MTTMTPPDTRSSRRPTLIAAATAATMAFAIGLPGAEAQVFPPPVPAGIEVPSGNTPFLLAQATGTQNYICLLTDRGFAWAFFGPQATLVDAAAQQVITHFLSSNPDENGAARAAWQHSQDTSSVWAAAVANSADPTYVAAGAIPWLLLRVVGVEDGPTGGATLSATTFVQRVNTFGGAAPAAAGCARSSHIGRKMLVPYTADYVFYRN